MPSVEIIEPSPWSTIGFTPNVFTGVMLRQGRDLWICRVSVYPSMQDQGHFTRMLDRLVHMGYRVRVSCPSRIMRGILERRGFTESRTCDCMEMGGAG